MYSTNISRCFLLKAGELGVFLTSFSILFLNNMAHNAAHRVAVFHRVGRFVHLLSLPSREVEPAELTLCTTGRQFRGFVSYFVFGVATHAFGLACSLAYSHFPTSMHSRRKGQCSQEYWTPTAHVALSGTTD